MRRLLLVDGTGVAYRCFHAIPALCSPSGQPTNAVYGFIRMLQALGAAWQPTHWAVALDGGVPEWRRSLWTGYKAQRPPMPDGLRAQLPMLDEYLERARICRIRLPGQEADDVLASLVSQCAEQSDEILIATSDKDLLQLVSDKVAAIPPVKGGLRCGPAEVMARLGVRPEQVVDWLAMAGDSVDGIPGVPGIGSKTAAKLLGQFGSLTKILECLNEVRPENVRESLRSHGEELIRNLGLVRLDATLDCVPAWEVLARQAESFDAVVPFYNQMGFYSLTRAAQEVTML
ncbi:MAG: 5'-3' exonuclease H3TH domain-containing protein [bacterium]